MPSYDQNNIFAKILRGELPCHKVYEDEKALAFLDIMPRAPGHAQVIPKAAARNILDVTADDRSEEHTSELQSHSDLVCRLLLEKKKKNMVELHEHIRYQIHYR